jgi:hypothetical protein
VIGRYITIFIGFLAVMLIIGFAAGWENGYWDKDKLAEPPCILVDAGEVTE